MEFLTSVDPVALATLTFAIVGFVELYKRLVGKDFKTAGVIAVAGLSGAILAPFAGDISWFIGMLIGFAGSGVITTASYLGFSKPVNP